MQVDTSTSISHGATRPVTAFQPVERSIGMSSRFVVFFVLIVLSALLWLPTGFDVSDIADGLRFFTAMNQPAIVSPSRPFTSVGFQLIYGIGQNWQSVNVGLMLMLAMQSWLLYLIAREFSLSASFAFALAALALFFPADQGVFYFGAINIRFALITFLAAFYFLLLYWKWRRPLALACSLFSLFLTGGTYELFYPLAFILPLTVFVLPARQSGVVFWRQWRRSAILWWGVIGICFAWTIFTLVVGSGHYQVGLLDRSMSIPDGIRAIWTLYRHILLDGFLTPMNIQLGDIACAFVATGLTFFMMRRLDASQPTKQMPRPLPLIAVGVVVILLGFLIHLPTSQRESDFRTLYVSSIGGAIVCIGMLTALQQRFHRQGWIGIGLCSLLVGLGCLQLINQHRAVQAFAEQQRTLARELTTLIATDDDSRPIVVIDTTPNRELEAVYGGSWYFESAVQIELQDYAVRVGFCYPDRPMWGSFYEYCALDDERIGITIFENDQFLSTALADTRLFTYDGAFRARE